MLSYLMYFPNQFPEYKVEFFLIKIIIGQILIIGARVAQSLNLLNTGILGVFHHIQLQNLYFCSGEIVHRLKHSSHKSQIKVYFSRKVLSQTQNSQCLESQNTTSRSPGQSQDFLSSYWFSQPSKHSKERRRPCLYLGGKEDQPWMLSYNRHLFTVLLNFFLSQQHIGKPKCCWLFFSFLF